MSGVLWFISRKLFRAVATVIGAGLVVFLLLHIAPGDPGRLMLGEVAPPSSVRALDHQMGLDKPLAEQIAVYIGHLFSGNLGTSFSENQSALKLILQAFPNTLELAFASFVLSAVLAIPVGVLSAAKRDSLTDHVTLTGLLVTQSLPTFWIGLLLIRLFSVQFHLLPSFGAGGWRHLLLPAVTLATFQVALLARAVRSGMLESLSQDYIRSAIAKGLSPRRILVVHAFPNTLITLVTILALQLGSLLGGAYITEILFSWPGIGRLGYNAIEARDYPLALAVVVFSSAMIVGANLFADLLYPIVDRRISK